MGSNVVTEFDVIVAGGGPAGLSVGSELARRGNKVLLLEKETAGLTKRSWFVPPFVLDDETRPFTYGGVTRFLASTFSGAKTQWKAELFPAYPFVDEKKILPYWVDVLKKNGSTVLDNCAYIDKKVSHDGVRVRTTKGDFGAKLFIDATGYESRADSDTASKKAGYYWWSVYGAIVEMDLTGGLEVGDYMMWQTFADTNANPDESLGHGRPVFEYEVLGPNKVYALLLFLRKERVTKETMEPIFTQMLRREKSTVPFHDSKILELKYGWYPSGGVSQEKAANRVAYIGDSACWTTPCGWGMTFVLQNYKRYAEKLDEKIKAGRLDGEALRDLPAFRVEEQFMLVFDRLVTHFLSNAPAPMLDKFINIFNDIDPILCEKIFTLKMDDKDLEEAIGVFAKNFTVRELATVLPPEDYDLVLEVLMKFGEATFWDVLVKWFDRIFGISYKPAAGGFSFKTEERTP